MSNSKISNLQNTNGYIPDSGLIAAADVAIKLGMPLLLTGEPGTGKTLFAKYIANQQNISDIHKFVSHTNSIYTDLFYTYDAIGHFRRSQKEDLDQETVEKEFINFKALGKAIESKKQSVVLIDEIDKAPRDFPNDLLEAIEDLSFTVNELQSKSYKYDGDKNPIIVITSNSEKDLPSAFLRRVIFYHIPFPGEELLVKIVTKRIFENYAQAPTDLTAIARHFIDIRAIDGLHKKPSTAEFLAWVTYLKGEQFDFSNLKDRKNMTLQNSYTILGKSRSDLQKINNL